MCFSISKLKNSTTFNFSLSTFNCSQAGYGGQIARATGGDQRAVEDASPYGRGTAARVWPPYGRGAEGRRGAGPYGDVPQVTGSSATGLPLR